MQETQEMPSLCSNLQHCFAISQCIIDALAYLPTYLPTYIDIGTSSTLSVHENGRNVIIKVYIYFENRFEKPHLPIRPPTYLPTHLNTTYPSIHLSTYVPLRLTACLQLWYWPWGRLTHFWTNGCRFEFCLGLYLNVLPGLLDCIERSDRFFLWHCIIAT